MRQSQNFAFSFEHNDESKDDVKVNKGRISSYVIGSGTIN